MTAPKINKVLQSILTLCCVSFAVAAPMSVTNIDGKTIEVRPQSLEGGTFKFKMKGQMKPFALPLTSLDEESQRKVVEWSTSPAAMPKDFRMRVELVRSNSKAYAFDYDDRRQVVSPKLHIENKSATSKSAPAKAVFIALGTPVNDTSRRYCISRDELDLPSLAKLRGTTLSFPMVTTVYDINEVAQYGYRQYGYAALIVVEDEVVEMSCHPRALEQIDAQQFLSVRKGQTYLKDFSDAY